MNCIWQALLFLASFTILIFTGKLELVNHVPSACDHCKVIPTPTPEIVKTLSDAVKLTVSSNTLSGLTLFPGC